MRSTRWIAGLSSLAITATALAATAPVAAAPADPDPAAPGVVAEGGRGPSTEDRASAPYRAQLAEPQARNRAAIPDARDAVVLPTSFPYQPRLRTFRDNPTGPNGEPDFNTTVPGLISHPEIAPFLNDLMSRSDRVSAQIIGQSVQGRDLYLVTVTEPESAAETARQDAWRDKIRNAPAAAATDSELLGQYKTPIWLSHNIHGNEWEGTDAALQYIEFLATDESAETRSILRNNRIYFSPSLNPDGRTNATRATALGFDPNRDMVTLTNPEPANFVRTADAVQAVYAADFHGYTNVLQMEPTGPPHGSNYEYDLYIPHNYALALAVEEHVVEQDIPGNRYLVTPGGSSNATTTTNTGFIKIPYRDTPDGWDDFPPIFTAQYAAFYGALTATVELPLRRNRNASNTAETADGQGTLISADRAAVNTEVAYETMVAIVDYLNQPAVARDLVRNQIETFRRGVAGEPKVALTTENVADVPGPEQWKPLWDVVDDQEEVQIPRAYVIPVGATQRSASDATTLAQRLIDVGIEVRTLDADTTVGGTTYPRGSYVVDMHQPLRGLANALLDLGEDISAKVPSMYDISAWSLGYLWGATVDKVGDVTDAAIGATTRIDAVNANQAMPAAGSYLTFELAGVADYRALNALLDSGATVSMIEDGSVVIAPTDRAKVAAVAAEFDIRVEAATPADLAALAAPSAKGLQSLRIAYVGNQDDRVSLEELGFTDLVQTNATGVNANPSLLDDVDVIWVGGGFTFSGAQTVGRDAVQAFLDGGGAMVGRTANALNAAAAFGLVEATSRPGINSGNGIVAVDTPAGSVLAPYAQDYSFVYPAVSFLNLGENTTAEQTYGAEPLLAGHWRSTNATNGPDAAAGNASVISGVHPDTGAKAMVFGTSVVYRNHTKGAMTQAARGLLWAASPGAAVAAPEPEVGKVDSRTGLKVKRIKGTRKVRLTIRVRSAVTPTGEIAIRRNGKVLRTIKLPARVDGVRKVRAKLVRGKNVLRVVYRGSATVNRSVSPQRVVRVR